MQVGNGEWRMVVFVAWSGERVGVELLESEGNSNLLSSENLPSMNQGLF